MTDEVLVEVCPRLHLDVLRNRAAVLNEQHRLLLLCHVLLLVAKYRKQLPQEALVGNDVVDNIDLVEEDEGIEDGEGGIVKYARKHDIFQVQQPIGVVDFPFDFDVLNLDDLLELGSIGEILAMVCAMGGEVGVI